MPVVGQSTAVMKHETKQFKSLAVALKELEPFIRNGRHLQSGRPFRNFGRMLSREVLANWLICVVINSERSDERMVFTSDPVGSDGIVLDTASGETWPMEHVMVPKPKEGEQIDVGAAILRAIENKNSKGGAAYASGKTLVVFLNCDGDAWFPNRVAKQLPHDLSFGAVWAAGLQRVEDGKYIYGVTDLHVDEGDAPTWIVEIASDFQSWRVERLQ
jgi:hypothetical protein